MSYIVIHRSGKMLPAKLVYEFRNKKGEPCVRCAWTNFDGQYERTYKKSDVIIKSTLALKWDRFMARFKNRKQRTCLHNTAKNPAMGAVCMLREPNTVCKNCNKFIAR